MTENHPRNKLIRKRVGYLLYNGFTALDVFGPLEAFNNAADNGGHDYQSVMLGASAGQYRADSGVCVLAEKSLDDVADLDILVVPGGAGSRQRQTQIPLCPWIKQNAARIPKVVSVCTGAFLLAESGLLDGLPATTHWQHAETFKRQYPKVKLNTDALFIQGKHISTSAGISAGIDLALKIIEDDCGAQVAASVARVLVVHYRRAGDQAQFSEPLKFQQQANGAFSSLSSWIMAHLNQDLSTARLAEQSDMSERTFYRKCQQQLGMAPSKYVETLRLDYARQLLSDKDWPSKRIALACGYQNVDVFRRAFERRFKVSPKDYRLRFNH